MNIRNFRLFNNDGAEYNLTVRDHFLHTPAGLGYTKETEFQRLGDQYIILDDAFAQAQITGEVFFPNPKAYDKYFDFVRFCQNTPLYLLYKPSEREFRRVVRLGAVGKEELQAGGLNVTVSFDCLTLFYEQFNVFGDASEAENGKTYNYKYNYRYSSASANTIVLDSDSYAESPCAIYIYGEVVNPVWRHYVNNVLFATGAINATIEAGQKLKIDTTEIPYSLTRVDMANRFVADVYAEGDFSTERFITLRHGRNTISVSHDTASPLTVALEARIVYASV